MKRQRVGGVDDDELPPDEEVEMEIHLPQHRAAVKTVGGQRVACISGIADVKSVLYHEDDYADVSHFAVLRICLNEASEMVRRLVEMKTTRQAMRISNASSLLQASALRSAIFQLSEDLSHLHEGLRNNCIIWELVSYVRAMPALPLNLQPGILRHGIDNLVEGIRATLAAFPAEPAGRHAGPNTIPATSHAAELYTNLAARVKIHLDAMDGLLANAVDYPDVPSASFLALDVELEQLEDEVVYKRIRGLDHLRLLLTLPNQGPLTEFCVSQLYLGDADDLLKELTAAMDQPYLYRFANFDRVQGACMIKNMVHNMSQTLQNIADGLIAGQFDPSNLEILKGLEDKFLKPALGQCQAGAFRDAAFELNARLMDLIDGAEDQLDLPTDVAASKEAVDAGEGGGAPASLAAVLTPLVERLLQQVGTIWGVSIEYADESLPEVLQAQAVLGD